MKSTFCSLLLILAYTISPHTLSADCCGGPLFQIGWFTATQGKSKHINIEGLVGDDFDVSRHSDHNFLIGAGYFFDGFCIDHSKTFYGINAFYFAPTKVKGYVTQENLYTNLSYHYDRTNYPVYFATKTFIGCCKDSDIVIDLGLGFNVISTSGFKERSLDHGITIPDKIFSGKTDIDFSATAGLGWRFNQFCDSFTLEINYRFFYLGEGKLKRTNNKVKNTLSTGTSYGNAIFFTVTL